jgi:acetyltransferase-like isoleucine patch superfamily enzyme
MARDAERFNHFKGITMKTGSRIGVNATILPGKTLAPDSCIAGGSLISKDTTAEEIWLGHPAKPFRRVPDSQLLKNNLDKK